MSGPIASSGASAPPGPPTGGADRPRAARRRKYSLLTRRDKVDPRADGRDPDLPVHLLHLDADDRVGLLSFTNWRGITPITSDNIVGIKNYVTLFTTYPFFWPAVAHNVLWLLFLSFIATPIGIFIAVLLDREMRGTRIYQSAFFIPVVLSLAVVGFIWQLMYTSQGFINSVLGTNGRDNTIDWLGNPSLNIWAVLVAASWRHVGYVMVLYLAGLKSVDPTLREAAAIDGANQRQTFFRVVFPVMRPINIVIIVITVIESLRAFDIAYIINRGKNGLELLSILIVNNSLSEASLIGFGTAIAVVLLVISLVPITIFLIRTSREAADQR